MDPLADRRARLSQVLRDTADDFRRRWEYPPATLRDMETAKTDLVRATELLTDLYCVFACDILEDAAPPMLCRIDTARRLIKKHGKEEHKGLSHIPPMVGTIRGILQRYGAILTAETLHSYLSNMTVMMEMGADVIVNEAGTELEFEL